MTPSADTCATPPDTWLVVPAKSFRRAKSRLASVHTPHERASLAERWLAHVLEVGLSHGRVAGALVVSADEDVRRFAEQRGALCLPDPTDAVRLNEIVDYGLAMLNGRGVVRALVLMGDLPHLRAADLDRVFGAAQSAPVVVVPDRPGEGTNALLVSPPERLPTCFGAKDSFRLHQTRLQELGIDFACVRTEGIAHDVDLPSDL